MKKIKQAQKLATERLLKEASPAGIWEGHLSSSAVSTAVAAFALGKLSPEDGPKVAKARLWLAKNINLDGGWGDTIESPSNLSAVLLTRATLMGTGERTSETEEALQKSAQWLKNRIGGTSPREIIEGVLEFYGKDRTFSIPILTVCALSGMLGQGRDTWKAIPLLPFEFAVMPHQTYHLLKLPVVSYAIPALIAVGIAQFVHSPPRFPLVRFLRQKAISATLKKLSRLAPSHGGFLEAAPLTGFVSTCLGCSGYKDHPVVAKALNFLGSTIREDGSWPIDTNLANWLTVQVVKSLDEQERGRLAGKGKVARYFRSHQFREIHPFTHAEPGGWGWTHLAGSVPDGDDTSGTLVALALLEPGRYTLEVERGLEWLLNLANRDGGIPTFCRGWGTLPFDRSCPDISAHGLQAFSLWYPHAPEPLQKRIRRAMARIVRYLHKSRDLDQVWTPLWFGDQKASGQTNRVYGTAAVLEVLATLPPKRVADLINPAVKWLKDAQNQDGGWGGDRGIPSVIETTGLAVSALALCDGPSKSLSRGAEYLSDEFIRHKGLPPSAPIGLYFASLWYDERLYPLLFGLRALNHLLGKKFYG